MAGQELQPKTVGTVWPGWSYSLAGRSTLLMDRSSSCYPGGSMNSLGGIEVEVESRLTYFRRLCNQLERASVYMEVVDQLAQRATPTSMD